jgi:hypothetical protein
LTEGYFLSDMVLYYVVSKESFALTLGPLTSLILLRTSNEGCIHVDVILVMFETAPQIHIGDHSSISRTSISSAYLNGYIETTRSLCPFVFSLLKVCAGGVSELQDMAW